MVSMIQQYHAYQTPISAVTNYCGYCNKRAYHWLAWRKMIRPQAARRPQCAVKWDRNLKPKLAIMHFRHRQTDTDIVA